MSACSQPGPDLVPVLRTDQAAHQAGGLELRDDLGVLRLGGRALATDHDEIPVGDPAIAQQPGRRGPAPAVPLRRQMTPTNSIVGGTRSARVGVNAATSTALSTVWTGVRPAKARIVSVPAFETVQTRSARRSVRSASRSTEP